MNTEHLPRHFYTVLTDGDDARDYGPFLTLNEARAFAFVRSGTVHELWNVHLVSSQEMTVVEWQAAQPLSCELTNPHDA
jgi:hypothetical protein